MEVEGTESAVGVVLGMENVEGGCRGHRVCGACRICGCREWEWERVRHLNRGKLANMKTSHSALCVKQYVREQYVRAVAAMVRFLSCFSLA